MRENHGLLSESVLNYPAFEIPIDKLFFPIVVDDRFFNSKVCEYCNTSFKCSNEYKYKSSQIVKTTIEKGQFGVKPKNFTDYTLVLSDITKDKPQGNHYLYKTIPGLKNKIFCSNECAYNYAIDKNAVITLLDMVNKAEVRLLVPQTKSMNEKIGNAYKYRGSYTGLKDLKVK